MLLSTSNSERQLRGSRLAQVLVVVLLLTIAVTLVSLEVFARQVIERRSKVQRMVNDEYSEAIQIRRPFGLGRKQLLIVGNSLVGHGVDFDNLAKRLPPDWEAHRFWIYNTSYDDWYFGLKRLLAQGSRPNVVAVVFAAMHWYGSGTRGDYAAQYMFQSRDLPEIQSRLKLDNTTTVSLLLSRYSKFYALRSEVRKVLLNSIVPDLPRMYSLFKPGPARQMPDDELIKVASERMRNLRELLRSYGASLIVVVPPMPRPGEEHQNALRIAAVRAGVNVVMPMTCADVPATDFADDVHLTPEGAKLFTARMVDDLIPEINKAGSSYRMHN